MDYIPKRERFSLFLFIIVQPWPNPLINKLLEKFIYQILLSALSRIASRKCNVQGVLQEVLVHLKHSPLVIRRSTQMKRRLEHCILWADASRMHLVMCAVSPQEWNQKRNWSSCVVWSATAIEWEQREALLKHLHWQIHHPFPLMVTK